MQLLFLWLKSRITNSTQCSETTSSSKITNQLIRINLGWINFGIIKRHFIMVGYRRLTLLAERNKQVLTSGIWKKNLSWKINKSSKLKGNALIAVSHQHHRQVKCPKEKQTKKSKFFATVWTLWIIRSRIKNYLLSMRRNEKKDEIVQTK